MTKVREATHNDRLFLIDLFNRTLGTRYKPVHISRVVASYIRSASAHETAVSSEYPLQQQHTYIVEDAHDGDFLGVICFSTHRYTVMVIEAVVLRGDARRKSTARALFAQVKRYTFVPHTAQMYYLIPNRPIGNGSRPSFTTHELSILEQEHA
jgi:hypothetical protein